MKTNHLTTKPCNIPHRSRQLNCWSPTCISSFACRRCCNDIFILCLTSGINGFGKANCNTRRETFMFWDLVRLKLQVWRWFVLRVKPCLHNIFFIVCQFSTQQFPKWYLPCVPLWTFRLTEWCYMIEIPSAIKYKFYRAMCTFRGTVVGCLSIIL